MNFASMLMGEPPNLPRGKARTYKLLNEPDQRPRGRHSRIKAEAMRKMVIKAMRSGCDEYATIQKHIGISASSVKRQVDYLVVEVCPRMNKIERFLFLRRKGLRLRLAWYCADLPRADDVVEFTLRFCTSATIAILLLVIIEAMNGR